MNQPKANIDTVSVQRATDHAKYYVETTAEQLMRYWQDPERKDRLASGECRFCFYMMRGRIGGAAMTSRPCAVCEKDVIYGSTNTDVLCLPCATEHQLCKHCGADALLRPRRVFRST